MNKPLAKQQIFSNGSTHFSALLNDIEQAKKTITLETYIFQNDNLGKHVVESLVNASKRGVKVRVLVDSAGTLYWSGYLAKTLEKAGVETRVFHPFPWQLWHWSRSKVKVPFLLKWIYLLLKANSRNHRKVCLIDDKIAYIGSANIAKCHLPKEKGGDNWRDISVRLTDISFHDLKKAFESAWSHRTIKERLRDAFKHIRREPTIRLNYSRHRRRILYKNILRKMRHCQQRIWITNAYFVPDNFLLRRLKEAAKSGIDVRILLPRKSDIFYMPWASFIFYHSLLKAGVRIFEYLPSVLHAKSLILDDWMSVGTSNLNHRSLLHDLEADVHIVDPEQKEKLMNIFLEDLKQSKEMTLKTWHNSRPWYQRLLGRTALYLKYFI